MNILLGIWLSARPYCIEKALIRCGMWTASTDNAILPIPLHLTVSAGAKKTNCLLAGRDINPWHMDVSFIDGVYRLIIYDRIDLSLWSSIDGKTFCYLKSLLLHSDVIGSFYYRELYRACLIKADNLYRLYFSANDMRTTSIGVMEGTTPEELKLISVDDSQNCHFHGFVFLYTYMKYKSLLFLKKRLCIMVKQTGRIKAGK